MPRGKKKSAKKRADPPASQQGAAIAQHATPATTTSTEKDYIGTSTRGARDPPFQFCLATTTAGCGA